LATRLGKKYCDETELLPLLLAHGIVRRVRTIEVTVQPLGGDSFKVTLDASTPSVGEAKAEIARVQGTTEPQQELYKVEVRIDGGPVREDDAEPELLEDNAAELQDSALVAMAVKEAPLVWAHYPAKYVSLGEDASIVTQKCNVGACGHNKFTEITTGIQMMAGKHYWEVLLLSNALGIYVGISRPTNLDRLIDLDERCPDTWMMRLYSGGMFGNGKSDDNRAGRYNQGDRVGLLLDLDDGSLRFFKNGVQHGPGYPAGSVKGPVTHALLMDTEGQSAKLLSGGPTWPAAGPS
jgi:hypothetical protein